MGTGSCFFASVRRGMCLPVGYTNTLMRRQVVGFMAMHPELFYRDIEEHLRVEYGTPVSTRIPGPYYHKNGPFSYYSYLLYMLRKGSYADEIMVRAISLMWGLRITVIHGEYLTETRYRHSGTLEHADLVLVHVGNHYSGVCKYTSLQSVKQLSVHCWIG